MTSQMHDVTAGTRAREIREHPEIPQPTFDPTDPRSGKILVGARVGATGAERVGDPTNPRYGEAAA